MDRHAEPSAIVAALAAIVGRVEAVARQLSAGQLMAPPAPGAWSPNEILWHIRATADVYVEQVTRILNEDQPRWRHVSPRARMKKARYHELPFAESLAAFALQRADLVTLLEGIPAEAWQRLALVRVPHNESEWRLTLQERLAGMAHHEQGHCAQMEKVAGALSQPV